MSYNDGGQNVYNKNLYISILYYICHDFHTMGLSYTFSLYYWNSSVHSIIKSHKLINMYGGGAAELITAVRKS